MRYLRDSAALTVLLIFSAAVAVRMHAMVQERWTERRPPGETYLWREGPMVCVLWQSAEEPRFGPRMADLDCEVVESGGAVPGTLPYAEPQPKELAL